MYDAAGDQYVCPGGKILSYEGRQSQAGQESYKYKAQWKDCQSCPLRMQCCPENKKHGRSITRSEESEAMVAFRAKMATEAAQAEYRKRGPMAAGPR